MYTDELKAIQVNKMTAMYEERGVSKGLMKKKLAE